MSKNQTAAITTAFLDLVIDSGELVRIEYRECTAEFLGMRLDRVSMARARSGNAMTPASRKNEKFYIGKRGLNYGNTN